MEQIIQSLPLEFAVIVGAFAEEFIAPLPSFVVMTAAGSAASEQNYTWWQTLLLAPIGAVGNALGIWLFYLAGKHGGSWVIDKFGTVVGVHQKEVDRYATKLHGSWQDEVIVFFLRVLPVVPSAPVSVAGGILRLPVYSFLFASWLGISVSNLMMLALGYSGTEAVEAVQAGLSTVSMAVTIGIVVAAFVLAGWAWYRKRQQKSVVRFWR